MSATPGCRLKLVHGDHEEFVALYESYLDAVYPPSGNKTETGSGRWKLMRTVAHEMRSRGAVDVLDCAAGTGFPCVDIAADSPGEFHVHCTDGDRAMVNSLLRRATDLGVSARALAPKYWPSLPRRSGVDALVLDWSRLGDIEGRYDYVLCRGNSLAYADTWSGRRRTASQTLIKRHLERMGRRVRPGGHLHVDAPVKLDLPMETYRPVGDGATRIWEGVSVEGDCRQWLVSFKPMETGPTISFKRYSSLLTIDRVSAALKELGFEDTDPVELPAERQGFGVVIARRPS